MDASAICSTLQSARHNSRPRFILFSMIPGHNKKYGVRLQRPAVFDRSRFVHRSMRSVLLLDLVDVRPRILVILIVPLVFI